MSQTIVSPWLVGGADAASDFVEPDPNRRDCDYWTPYWRICRSALAKIIGEWVLEVDEIRIHLKFHPKGEWKVDEKYKDLVSRYNEEDPTDLYGQTSGLFRRNGWLGKPFDFWVEGRKAENDLRR